MPYWGVHRSMRPIRQSNQCLAEMSFPQSQPLPNDSTPCVSILYSDKNSECVVGKCPCIVDSFRRFARSKTSTQLGIQFSILYQSSTDLRVSVVDSCNPSIALRDPQRKPKGGGERAAMARTSYALWGVKMTTGR